MNTCVHSYDSEIYIAVEVEYCGTPGSRGYSTLAEGQLEPDTEPEVEIVSVSIAKYSDVAKKAFRLDLTDYLPDEVLQELTREIAEEQAA